MIKFLKSGAILVVSIAFSFNLFAQEIPLDVANISDQQLAALITKYQLNGLSDAEFTAMAKQKGLSPEQTMVLKKRIAEMDPLSGAPNANYKTKTTDENTVVRNPIAIKAPGVAAKSTDNTLKVFGSELFEKEGLSFEPNLTIATPKNYLIGVGDELVIDIYGLSESTKKLKVNTEGYIRFPNLGPIKVSGLTIEEAQVKIKNQAAKVYTTIASGNTNVIISVGQIRSIRVTLIGEVNKPGNYSVSSLSTIMNALYASGGPNAIGSFRKIELVRSGKTIVVFDLYDFLLKGDLTKNKILQDEDVIRVAPYENRVAVKGASKKQALFDVKKGESAQDILNYAGGFSDLGYKEMIRVKRMGNTGKEVITVKANQLASFHLMSGDTLVVDPLAQHYLNRVYVGGAVYYPGEYGINEMPTLKTLLTTVQVKENAYYDRAIVRRLNPDLTPSILHFNVLDILNGKNDISLFREDSIHIYLKEEMREKYSVTINGEVNSPNTFLYADSMRVQDLILLADGFKEGASMQRIEIARRLKGLQDKKDSSTYSIIKAIDLTSGVASADDLNFVLAPFDIVSVRKSPIYKEQITVSVDGEVMYPGKYTLSGNNERLSEIIKRAGGLKSTAFPIGAMLLRRTKINPTDPVLVANKADSSKGKTLTAADLKPVGIRLNLALREPGSLDDIILEEGDDLKVPKLLQTVQTSGAVQVPRQVTYYPGMTFNELIRKSGWFTSNAARRHAYLVRANGEIKSTKRFLIFHFYPKIEPGAEVFVPAKKPTIPMSPAEYIGIGSSVASLAGLIIALINATK